MHFLFLLRLSFWLSGAGAKYFSNEVDNILNDLNEIYSMDKSVENARLKMDGEKFKDFDNDYKKAGMLINLYTNADDIRKLPSSRDKEQTIYSTLNQELRSGNPDLVWLKYEKLLNQAIDIIGQEAFEILFRGERCCKISVPDDILDGSLFNVRRFWSTTLDPYVTELFGGADYAFYIVKKAVGVKVLDVSASVTDIEKEVLIQSSKTYKLEKKIVDEKEKLEMFKSIKLQYPDFDFSEFHPEKIFVLVAQDKDQDHDEL